MPDRLALALACALAAGCTLDDPPTETATAELVTPHQLARASLELADALLGASVEHLGAADGLWPWLTDGAAYLHPGAELIVGRDAARTFLRATYPDAAAASIALHRVAGDVSADAHLGYTFGWFDQAGGTGRYLAVWQRGLGAWRLAAFLRRDALAAPAAAPADALIIDGEHGTPIPGDPAALRAQVIAADAAFAATSVASGYSIAFPAFAADAAIVTTRRDYRWNAAGVAAFWVGWTPNETFDWTPVLGGATASGDLAYTVGTAAFTTADPPSESRSKYITVWVRSADGSWRWLVDDGNELP